MASWGHSSFGDIVRDKFGHWTSREIRVSDPLFDYDRLFVHDPKLLDVDFLRNILTPEFWKLPFDVYTCETVGILPHTLSHKLYNDTSLWWVLLKFNRIIVTTPLFGEIRYPDKLALMSYLVKVSMKRYGS